MGRGGYQFRTYMLRSFKASGCRACGKRYPEIDWTVLHVHHIDPTTKSRGSKRALSGNEDPGLQIAATTQDALLGELTQCEVLCSECHSAHHRNGMGRPAQLSLFTGTGAWGYPK